MFDTTLERSLESYKQVMKKREMHLYKWILLYSGIYNNINFAVYSNFEY